MLGHQGILERCIALASEGRSVEAETVAGDWTRFCPDDGHGWLALGHLQYRRGGLAEALRSLETASLLIPLDPPSRAILAECFAKQGHPELAKHLYQLLAVDDRTPDGLLPAIAAGLGWLGQYSLALSVCLEMTRRNPELPEAHFGVAFYLRKLGRPPEAVLPIVARAHELAPSVSLYRISLATLLDHVGQREEARDLLRNFDLDAVSCQCCLRRMTTIFLAAPNPTETEGRGDLEI